jgi:hypothetical protein
MNNSQSLSQDIIYNLNFSNDFSIDDSNSITDILINDKIISEENIILPEWYEDKLYLTIVGIFLSVIIAIIIYIFIQYF